MQNTKNIFIIVIGIALLAGIGTYFYKSTHSAAVSSVSEGATTTTPAVSIDATSDTSGVGHAVITITKGDTGTAAADSSYVSGIPLPDLNRSIVMATGVDEQVFAGSKTEILRVEGELKKDPKNVNNWLNLGIYRKSIHDYEGARDIFLYVTKAWPKYYIGYNNLGDIYEYYLKNYPLAEVNIYKVIELEPRFLQAYTNLNELYKYLYTEKKGEQLSPLLLGLKNNPDSVDFMVQIARYYALAGDKTNAETYYNKAIAAERKLENKTLEDALLQELKQVLAK